MSQKRVQGKGKKSQCSLNLLPEEEEMAALMQAINFCVNWSMRFLASQGSGLSLRSGCGGLPAGKAS